MPLLIAIMLCKVLRNVKSHLLQPRPPVFGRQRCLPLSNRMPMARSPPPIVAGGSLMSSGKDPLLLRFDRAGPRPMPIHSEQLLNQYIAIIHRSFESTTPSPFTSPARGVRVGRRQSFANTPKSPKLTGSTPSRPGQSPSHAFPVPSPSESVWEGL